MNARARRPTIRRVKDWEPSVVSLRPPRVPLDLVPRAKPVERETVKQFPAAPMTDVTVEAPHRIDDPDPQGEAATLARFVPLDSEIRAILDDPEDTLAYMRKVQETLADPDSALDSLVAVYEERVAKIAREREEALAIVTKAKIAAEDARD